MSEMSRRERIMAASRGERADRLPFFHFWRHCQIGRAERECRNRGMGICWTRPCQLVTPRLFEQYFMPVYAEQARLLHGRGKLMAVHMDGRLKGLAELIGRTEIDIVEAFHPPPMGDLPPGQALALWPGKAIWVGFPGSAYAMGPPAVREQALALLAEAIPGDRLVVEMSTENLVSNENLLALTEVLEPAALPLSGESVREIERSLRG